MGVVLGFDRSLHTNVQELMICMYVNMQLRDMVGVRV